MDIFESLENLEVSEACFDEIMDIVEEVINELNKYEQYKVDKDPKLKKELENRQEALKDIGDIKKERNNAYTAFRAEDILADENRDALERDRSVEGVKMPKISYSRPDRRGKRDKSYSGYKKIRTEQSQRGSSKDVWNSMDPLMNKVRKANNML